MNTTECLEIASLIAPDRLAVIFEKNRLTYEVIVERINRLATALIRLGIQRSDRVAIIQVNTNEHIETYFAVAKLDAVFVPLNFRSKEDELTYMINVSGAKIVLAGPRYRDLILPIIHKLNTVEHFISLEDDTDVTCDSLNLPTNWQSYETLIANASQYEGYPESDGDDLSIIMFTAGTTGSPKGVMLSHESFTSYILDNVAPIDPDTEERNILTVPLYHIAGVQAMMAAIYGGRTLVIQRQFDSSAWIELVEREKVDRAMIVPTMLKQILDNPDFASRDLSSLRVITYGAAPMPLEIIKKAIVAFPDTHFINAFGQTETAATISMLPPEAHVLTGSPGEVEIKVKRLASIGKPLPDIDIKIVDEEGKSVSIGEIGEIVARGPRVMKGYWKEENATKETVRDGWLHTGDLGYFDDEGYIFLSGRAKDFIKRGGEMISPEEVEQVLQSHPAVDEAAIIGIPDPEWGERVRAIVVVKRNAVLTEREIIEYCRQNLSSFKKPESVIFEKKLPRNSLGKVLKRVLRESYSHPISCS